MKNLAELGKWFPNIKDPLDSLPSNVDLLGAEEDLSHNQGEQDLSGVINDMLGDGTMGHSEILGEDMGRSEVLGSEILGSQPGRQEILGIDALTELMGDDPSSRAGDSDSGDWLYKLNPTYWTKSQREKHFLEVEHDSNEQARKQSKEVEAGRRAAAAAAEAQQLSSELSSLETKLQGMSGDDPTTTSPTAIVTDAVQQAQLAAQAQHHLAYRIAQKLASGVPLSTRGIQRFRELLQQRNGMRRFRRAYLNTVTDNPTTAGAFVGKFIEWSEARAPGSGKKADKARAILAGWSALGHSGTSMMGGRIPKQQWIEMMAISASHPNRLPAYWRQKNITMTPGQMVHLKNLTVLTKNEYLKQKTGKSYINGNTDVGDFFSVFSKVVASPFKILAKVAPVALLPVAGTAYGFYKGGQYAFGKKKQGQTPEQKAAADQAKADAAAAQAQAQADATAAQPPAPGADTSDDLDDDTAGSFLGSFVGFISDARAKKIAMTAAENSPAGLKVRAGAKLYKAAKKNSPQARRAIASMQKKAKSGDLQAQRDLNAVKAGKIALAAKAQGKQRESVAKKFGAFKQRLAARHAASKTKGNQVRNKLEYTLAQPLIITSRRQYLKKASKLEAASAKGHPIAKAQVAKIMAKAKAGDPKAKAARNTLVLARRARLATKTPSDRAKLKAAGKLAADIRKKKPSAVRQGKIINDAAKAGNKDAIALKEKINAASALQVAVATGVVATPIAATAAYKHSEKKKKEKEIKRVLEKMKRKAASREEALAAAKKAQEIGQPALAGQIAQQAAGLPSAAEPIKKAEMVAAAAQANNPEAKAAIDKAMEQAKAGDPAGIQATGHLAAVQALDTVRKGEPMPKPIAEASELVERAQAGDPEAKRIIERASTGAQAGEPAAVEAAVALVAASQIAKAIAHKESAKVEWKKKAQESLGTAIPIEKRPEAEAELAALSAKVKDGSATTRDADRAIVLATALGKPGIAAAISARKGSLSDDGLHPMSTPDVALPPIRSFKDAMVESLRALTFSTPDPFQNFFEGVKARETTVPMSPQAPLGTSKKA